MHKYPRSPIRDNDLQLVGSNHIVRFECVNYYQGNQSIVYLAFTLTREFVAITAAQEEWLGR
jgi:hypothetical protein